MCQAQPGPRCTSHTYTDYQKALTAFNEVLRQQDAGIPVSDEKVAEKQRILQKREHEYNLACVAAYERSKEALHKDDDALQKQTKVGHIKALQQRDKVKPGKELKDPPKPLAPEKRIRLTEIVERAEGLKADEDRWEELRRERYVQGRLAEYEHVVRKGGSIDPAEAFNNNPRLIADAMSMLQELPESKSGGGRGLTFREQEVLAQATDYINTEEVDDYLPAEETVPHGKVAAVKDKAQRTATAITEKATGERSGKEYNFSSGESSAAPAGSRSSHTAPEGSVSTSATPESVQAGLSRTPTSRSASSSQGAPVATSGVTPAPGSTAPSRPAVPAAPSTQSQGSASPTSDVRAGRAGTAPRTRAVAPAQRAAAKPSTGVNGSPAASSRDAVKPGQSPTGGNDGSVATGAGGQSRAGSVSAAPAGSAPAPRTPGSSEQVAPVDWVGAGVPASPAPAPTGSASTARSGGGFKLPSIPALPTRPTINRAAPSTAVTREVEQPSPTVPPAPAPEVAPQPATESVFGARPQALRSRTVTAPEPVKGKGWKKLFGSK